MARNSTHRFSPKPNNLREHDGIVSSLRTILGKSKAAYVSSPFTSGKRFLHWYLKEGIYLQPKSHSYQKGLKENVSDRNLDLIRPFVEDIRTKRRYVYSPCEFSLTNWSQDEYYFLSETIIVEYIDVIYFMDGWEYSNGCCYELVTAFKSRLQIELLSEKGMPIFPENALKKMENTTLEIESYGASSDFHKMVIGEFKKELEKLL